MLAKKINKLSIATLAVFSVLLLCGFAPYTPDANTVLIDHFDGATSATILAYSQDGAACGPTKPSATPVSAYGPGPDGLGQALSLSPPEGQPAGSTTYLQYPGGQLLSQPNGTIEFWTYLTTYGTGRSLVSQGPYPGSCAGWTFGMSVSATGQLQVGAWAAFSMDSGATTVPLNAWTHVAATWGSTGAKLYINGALVGSSANTGMPASGYGGVVMVNYGADAVTQLDELRISNVQRTSFSASGLAGTGTHNASGTYEWNATTGVTTFNWTSSDFTCEGPSLGISTDTGVIVTDTTMTIASKSGDTWTRPSGAANSIVGIWMSTNGTTGNSYELTFNANGTVSVTGVIVSCGGGTISFSGWVMTSPNWPVTDGMTPISGATVNALPGTGPSPFASDVTNTDGSFSITGIPASSPFRLVVPTPAATTYVPVLSKFMNWNADIQALLPFALFTQDQYTNILQNPAGTGIILGRVALKNSPTTFLSGATIEAREWIAGTPPTLGATYPVTYTSGSATQADGVYMVKNVPAGKLVQLVATLPNHTFEFNNAVVPTQPGFISEESFFGTPSGGSSVMTYPAAAAFASATPAATVVNFDDLTTSSGKVSFAGSEYAVSGVTFSSPNMQPLWVYPPQSIFWTRPSNYLSPGAAPNEGGDSNEDSLTLTFSTPVAAVGWNFLDLPNPAAVTIRVYDQSNGLIHEALNGAGIGTAAADGSRFWGITSPTRLIARVEIIDTANNGDDVAYDDFRFATTVVTPTISFSSKLKKYSDDSPVSGGVVELVGSDTVKTTTASDGSFLLSGLPSGTPFTVRFSKPVSDPTAYVYSYTTIMQATAPATITAKRGYNLFTLDQLNIWSVGTGRGVIRGRIVDNANVMTGYIGDAAVTYTSSLNNTYSVKYEDPQGNLVDGTGSYPNGKYYIVGVAEGDTVTVSATQAHYNFSQSRTFIAHDGAMHQSSLNGAINAGKVAIGGYIKDTASTPAGIKDATVEQVGASPANQTASLSDGLFNLVIPVGTPVYLKFSKPSASPALVPTYSAEMTFGGSNPNIGDFNLYPATTLSGWGILSGKGVIRARAKDQAGNYLGGVTMTAQGLSNPYPVCYDDACTLTETDPTTGRFIVKNVDPNDTVTVTAQKAGWAFNTNPRIFHTYADSMHQGGFTGKPTGNLVQNGGFAGGLNPWVVNPALLPWNPLLVDGTVNINPPTQGYIGRVLYQNLNVTGIGGKTVYVSLNLTKIGTPPAGNTVALWLTYLDAGNALQRVRVLNPGNDSITNNTFVVGSVTLPAGAQRLVTIEIDKESDGEFHVDNVVLWADGVTVWQMPAYVGTWGAASLQYDNINQVWYTEASRITFNADGTGTIAGSKNDGFNAPGDRIKTFAETINSYTIAPNTDGSYALSMTIGGETVNRRMVLSDDGNMAVMDGTDSSAWEKLTVLARINTGKSYSNADVAGEYYSIGYESNVDNVVDPPNGNGRSMAISSIHNFSGTSDGQGAGTYTYYGKANSVYFDGHNEVWDDNNGGVRNYTIGQYGAMTVGNNVFQGAVSGNGNILGGAGSYLSNNWFGYYFMKKGDRAYATADLSGKWAVVSFGQDSKTTEPQSVGFDAQIGTMTCDSAGQCSFKFRDRRSGDGSTNISTGNVTLSVASDGSFGTSLGGSTPSYGGAIGNNGNTIMFNASFNPAETWHREIFIGVRASAIGDLAGDAAPDEALINTAFHAAVAAFNAKDVTTFMSYFSADYLDGGRNRDALQARFNQDIVNPNWMPRPTSFTMATTVTGTTATSIVSWPDGTREKQFFIKDGSDWKIYGNQEKYEAKGGSVHIGSNYYGTIQVLDPAHAIQSVRITIAGGNLSDAVYLTWSSAQGGIWDGWQFNYGQNPPANAVYDVQIIDTAGTYTYQRVINGGIAGIPANLAPTGTVTGSVVFTFAAAQGAAAYTVQIYRLDQPGNFIWFVHGVPGTTISYAGPALTPGVSYGYDVAAEFQMENGRNISIASAQFTYTGSASPISVSGIVRDWNGGVIPAGATVTLVGDPTKTTPASTTDGSFSLSGVPANTPFSLKFSASAAGYLDVYTVDIGGSPSNMNISIDAYGGSSPINMPMPSDLTAFGALPGDGKALITGRVADQTYRYSSNVGGVVVTAISAGHPAPGYTVTYRDPFGVLSSTPSTWGNGRYYVLNVDGPDTVTVTAAKTGWNFPSRTFHTQGNALSQGRIFGTSPGYDASLSGFVRNSAEVAVSGATMSLNGDPGKSTVTYTDGSYTFSGLPRDAYFYAKVTASGYVPAYAGPVNLAGSVSGIHITMLTTSEMTGFGVSGSNGLIGCTVMDPSMSPLSGATVILTSKSGTVYTAHYEGGGGATSATGKFLVPNIVPGDVVKIEAAKSGYIFNPYYLDGFSGAITEKTIFGTAVQQTTHPAAATIQTRFEAAMARFNAIDFSEGSGFAFYVSASFLDRGLNKTQFVAEAQQERTAHGAKTWTIQSITGAGDYAAMALTWNDGQTETLYFRKEGGVWLLYGNQKLFDIWANSGHQMYSTNPFLYWVSLAVEDPDSSLGVTISGVHVTGAGLPPGGIDLYHNTTDKEWHSWSQSLWEQDRGPKWATAPTLPLDYVFTVNYSGGSVPSPEVQTFQVKTFVNVAPLQASLIPQSGSTATRPLTFYWGSAGPGYRYGIEVYDANGNRIWWAYDLTGISVTYGGPALGGGQYNYNLLTQDAYWNNSMISTPFQMSLITLKGDLDGSGSVNLTDAIIAMKAVSGLDVTSVIRPYYAASGADVNNDNRIGLQELIYILQYVAGLRQ